MARRKRHHSRRKSHRRSVGAFRLGGGDTGMKLLAIGAGYFLGDTINDMVDKVLPKTTDATPVPTQSGQTMAVVGEIGLGGLLLMKKKSGQTGMLMGVAGGILIGAGAKRALKVMKVITGYQSTPVIGMPMRRAAGYQNTPVIGGNVTPGQLTGRTPMQLSGYRSQGSGVGAYTNQGSGVMGAIGSCDGTTGSGITSDDRLGY